MRTNQDVIAVVTGANRGIGFAIVRQLADRGVTVVLTARRPAAGATAAAQLAGAALPVAFHALSVTDEASIRALRDHLAAQFGRLDVLVNNAGMITHTEAGGLDVSLATVRETLETNTLAPLRMAQMLLPLLQKSPAGRIVNMSSGMGALSEMEGGYAAYRISKAALNAVTGILAAELAASGIAVNAMCPGWVKTDMGGAHAERHVSQGAETAVWLALDAPQAWRLSPLLWLDTGMQRRTTKTSNPHESETMMHIAVLGTGMVGNAIATTLVKIGHHIMMGSRTATSEAGQAWLRAVGGQTQCGTFAEAAAFGAIIFNCTNGANALVALRQAGAANLRGEILIDVANPLDMSTGMPPALTVCNTDSLGEQVQREFPNTRVVKALNTMNCDVMVQPSLVPGDHTLFLCGNDAEAKREVSDRLCAWFGWNKANIIDLGDISAARGMEMFLPLWLRLWRALGTGHFNMHVVRGH